MSIVWQRNVGDIRYQVRKAGRSLRLYTNGVFHSQYNPARPLSGNVWDLLFLPAFFYPPEKIRRVLVLGVGGGAVVQQLRRFVQPEHIIGVELSEVHISIAKRFFGVRGSDVELVKADAVDWLAAYRGKPFDMIIDDLFAEADGQAVRAVRANRDWVSHILAHLAGDGVVVSNFPSWPELEFSAYLFDRQIRSRFSAGFHLSTPQNFNAVGAFLCRPANTRQLRRQLRRDPELDPGRKSSRLTYRIKTLF